MGIHADLVADAVRVRGFAGLPDGSAWVVDEILWPAADGAVEGHDTSAKGTGARTFGRVDTTGAEAAGAELARRMLAAGAADVLRDAERMAEQRT